MYTLTCTSPDCVNNGIEFEGELESDFYFCGVCQAVLIPVFK